MEGRSSFWREVGLDVAKKQAVACRDRPCPELSFGPEAATGVFVRLEERRQAQSRSSRLDGKGVEMIFGTRTLSVETMRYIEKRMEAIAFGVASGMNCTINFEFAAKIPPVINDAEMTAGLVATIESLFGKESLFETPPLMPSEDFSKYQEKAPGVLLFLGTGDESKETHYAQHHPKFKVDDDVLYKGVAAIAQYAVHFINKTAAQ